MKRILSLVALIVTVAFAAAADDISFKIDFDNHDAVTVVRNYSETLDVHDGINDFTMPMYTSLTVQAAPGYAIKSVIDMNGTEQTVTSGIWSVPLFDTSANGQTYKVVTANLADMRTARFAMNIDNPAAVSATLSGTGAQLTLEQGLGEYAFDPQLENVLYLASTGPAKLYKVTVDNVAIPVTSTTVEVPLTDGCLVDVHANYPDKPVTVTILYDKEQCPGLISGYSINYETDNEYEDLPIELNSGDAISIFVDIETYMVDNVTIDGVPLPLGNFDGSFTFNPADDATVSIAAHAYRDFEVTVNIEFPDHIRLYAGYQLPEYLVPLVPGKNIVKVNEFTPVLSWIPAANCRVVSVTSPTLGEINGVSVNVTEGTELTFVTSTLQSDMQFVYWIDDIKAAQFYCRLVNAEGISTEIADGYNIISFVDSYNPYQVSWVGAPTGYLYVNNERVSPMYDGSTYWEVSVSNGDVVKAFLKAAPVDCKVTFEIEGGGDAAVTTDVITPCALWRDGIDCMAGTMIAIAPAEDVTTSGCMVNGVAVEPDAAGSYIFTVGDAATAVALTLDNSGGVADVTPDMSVDDTVYNLQGMAVGTRAAMSSLPAGLYIAGGRKVIVR